MFQLLTYIFYSGVFYLFLFFTASEATVLITCKIQYFSVICCPSDHTVGGLGPRFERGTSGTVQRQGYRPLDHLTTTPPLFCTHFCTTFPIILIWHYFYTLFSYFLFYPISLSLKHDTVEKKADSTTNYSVKRQGMKRTLKIMLYKKYQIKKLCIQV